MRHEIDQEMADVLLEIIRKEAPVYECPHGCHVEGCEPCIDLALDIPQNDGILLIDMET